MKSRKRLAVPISVVVLAFVAGMAAMWVLVRFGPPMPKAVAAVSAIDGTPRVTADTDPTATKPVPTISDAAAASTAVATAGNVPHGSLRVPIDGADPSTWKGAFNETRDGTRSHEAVDILAPRNTPIHAAADGTIAKLFVSKAGGNTIYEFDAAGRICYYYAHLERYADGLREGEPVLRGDVIGYVGTSGNAPRNTPHLHFAVFKLAPDKRWWKGKAIDPYDVFTRP